MKKNYILLIVVFVSNLNLMQAQNTYYYDESGNRLYLNKTESVKFITVKSFVNTEKKELIRQKLNAYGNGIQEKTPKTYKLSLNAEQNSMLRSYLQKDTANVCISPMLMYSDSTVQWTSNEIIVKIPDNADLRKVLNNHSIPYEKYKNVGSDLHTFVVSLSGFEDKTFYYANLLFESGNVVYAQPSFWRQAKKHNPLSGFQWGLFHETIGINAPAAWQIATGANIKVAVLDDGVDLYHEDLSSNLLSGYDATNGYSVDSYGYNGWHTGNDNHGTACAGIIAASDNNKGIKGVAYDAKIIPVRIAYTDSYGSWITYDVYVAAGIHEAWLYRGADILSCSWSMGSNSSVVNYEMNEALTQGRNGKGCIVVFAAGNYYYHESYNFGVKYPANSNPDILTVGAIMTDGRRKHVTYDYEENLWGSCFSNELDLVAPGVNIPTTDLSGSFGGSLGNYLEYFSGTSAACPHVAGVAALVLSVNPSFTGKQVRDIIERTARKIRTDVYGYSAVSNHPNPDKPEPKREKLLPNITPILQVRY
jgi:subtilisin family serine protease